MHFFQLHLAWSLAGLLATEALAQTPPLEQAASAILEAHCLTCHGAARMSGLDLRQRETLLKGDPAGDYCSGKTRGGPSLQISVSGTSDLKMPPGQPALSVQDLVVLG